MRKYNPEKHKSSLPKGLSLVKEKNGKSGLILRTLVDPLRINLLIPFWPLITKHHSFSLEKNRLWCKNAEIWEPVRDDALLKGKQEKYTLSVGGFARIFFHTSVSRYTFVTW